MTKMKLTAIAASTWMGGFAAAATLAYVVHRPLPPAVSQVDVTSAIVTPFTKLVPLAPEAEPERVIVLPTVELVVTRSKPVTVAPPAPTHQQDISEMRCSDWRPLQQGSNAVQICD